MKTFFEVFFNTNKDIKRDVVFSERNKIETTNKIETNVTFYKGGIVHAKFIFTIKNNSYLENETSKIEYLNIEFI